MANDFVEMRLESEDFACEKLQIHLVRGKEAISRLFSFDIEVVCLDPAGLDPAAVTGARATIVVLRSDEEVRRIHGMIAAVQQELDDQVEFHTYTLRLVPRVYGLGLVETQELFLDTNVPAILTQKLEALGLGPADFQLRLSASYADRDLFVQYKESDLAFVSRLAEHLGMSFVFEHEDQDRIVFLDEQSTFPELPPARLRPRGDRRDVYQLAVRTQVVPALYVVQDYNYRTPQVDLTGSHELPGGYAGGVIEHGGHFKTTEEAAALARSRAEERQVEQRVYTGESDLPAFSAGRRFALEGPHPMRLLLVEVEHDARFPTLVHGGQGDERHYKNTFRAIPEEHTYRPPRVTPRPRISGLVTGIIEHGIELGVERWSVLDAWGRYTVRFLFDTAGHDQKQSRQIRMLQPHVGTNYGMHFPLKPGTEVLIGFVDGDPDRPLIVGAVYRPDIPSPVATPNHVINKLKSESGIVIEMKDS